MSTETNTTIIRRLYDEFFNKGDLSIADDLHAADSSFTMSSERLPLAWKSIRNATLSSSMRCLIAKF